MKLDIGNLFFLIFVRILIWFIYYCVKKFSSCSKNDTFSGGVPTTVKPGQQRRGFFFTGRGI